VYPFYANTYHNQCDVTTDHDLQARGAAVGTTIIQEREEELCSCDIELSCKEPLEITRPGFARINLSYFMDDETVHFVLEAVDMVATQGWKLLPQYRFDPHTGAWENRSFNKSKPKPILSLHDVIYDDVGGMVKNTAPRDHDVKFEEINTLDDKKVEFFDDKNKLIWFLQPQEAQFYLVAETLRHKPKASLVRTKLPFKPRTMSRMNLNRKWPELHEIQEYLRRLKAAELTRGEGENGRLALKNRKK